MNLHMNIKLTVAALFVPFAMMTAQPKAVIGVSAAYLRVAPDYESALDSQELMGRVVEILDTDRYWVKVAVPMQMDTAWVNEKQLVPMDDDALAEWSSMQKHIVTAVNSSVRVSPGKDSGAVCDLVFGDIVSADGRARRGMTPVLLPDGRRGWVPSSDLMRESLWNVQCAAMNREQKCNTAISYAYSMLGTPYLWGGMSSKGCDCSGLVRVCFLMAGVNLPRNSSQQYRAGRDIPVGRNDDGSFDLSALQRGDLVFFGSSTPEKLRITHVGIYLGDGRMIQSSQVVRVNSLVPGREDFYENAGRLVAACRIVE